MPIGKQIMENQDKRGWQIVVAGLGLLFWAMELDFFKGLILWGVFYFCAWLGAELEARHQESRIAELKRDQIHTFGPDPYSSSECLGPMSAAIERAV